MKKLYNQVKRYQWREDEYAMPVIARFGTGGGNMPVVVEVLPFDTTQITSDKNYSHPTWGVLPSSCQRSAPADSRDKENRWNL